MNGFSGVVVVVSLCVLVGGCIYEQHADETEATEPTSLTEVTIPTDFNFETTRPIELEIEVAETLREGGEVIVLEVRRPNGGLVFQSIIRPQSSSAARIVQLPLPLAIDELIVTARGNGWTRESSVRFSEDNTATHVFR